MVGVGNFCFNLLSAFLSILHIISSQAIFFLFLLYGFFPQFRWSTLLSFPSYFKLHNLRYLKVDVSTYDMTIPLQTAFNHHIFDLHSNTHPILKNISRHPIDQSHPTHDPDHTMLHLCLIWNSTFPRFTTVQRNWSNTKLINLPPLPNR